MTADVIHLKTKRLKNLSHETTRHGKKVWYYLVEGTGRRIRIKGEYGTRAFMDQYNEILLSPRGDGVSHRRVRAEEILRMRVKNALSRDRAKGRASDITPEWAIEQLQKQQYTCALTGIEFLFHNALSKNNPYAPSIDRIDNRLGYIQENVRIVLFGVNAMLLDWGTHVLDHIAAEYFRKSRLALKIQCDPQFHNPLKGQVE